MDRLPWRVVLAVLFLVLAMFAPVLFGEQVLLPLDNLRGAPPFESLPAPAVHGNHLQGDLVLLIAPAQARVRAALAEGRWPLWNPLVGAGVPLLADPQAQAWAPLQLLALPFSLVTAAAVVAALRVLAAVLFTFLLLRRQGLVEGAALAGGLAWGLGGFVMLWLGWPLANVGALLPAVLWATALALDRGRRRDLVVLAVATAALALGGHPETELYAGVFAAAFALARARGMARRGEARVGRRLAAAAGVAAIGALLAAPVLLPAAHAAARSERAAELSARRVAGAGTVQVAAPDWERDWQRWAIGRWLPVVAPNAFGNDRFGRYWGPQNSNEDSSGFVGSATVLLALLGVASTVRARRPRLGPAVAARRASDSAGPAGWPSLLRPQERLLQVTVVLSLLLAALPPALRPWADRLPLALQSTTYYHRLLLLVGFGLACLAAYELDRVARGDGARRATLLLVAAGLAALIVWGTLAHPLPSQPHALDVLRFGWLRWHLRLLGAAALLLALARGRTWVAPAVAALIAGELLLAHAPANPPLPPALAFPRLPAIAFLQARPGEGRLLGLDGALPPNVASVYGLADLRAYDPMAPARCSRALAPFARLRVADLSASAARSTRHALRELGVRWLVAAPGAVAPAGFRVAFGDGTATVLEGAAQPLWRRVDAGAVAQPTGGGTPGDRGASGGARLLGSVCQDGGWHVLADREPVPLAGADGAFVAAPLPAGAGAISLLHRPPRFLAGCLAAAVGAAALLLVAVPPPVSSRAPWRPR